MIASKSDLAAGGTRISGQAVRDQNASSVAVISNILKSSLGPVGLDKMLVDSIGDVTISNDGATILRLLEVEHPAAKILVELAQRQDEEIGDGTTSVVLIAAELVKKGNELVKVGKLHPTTVINGFRLACREACRFVSSTMSISIETLGKDFLVNCAKTSLSSKVIGVDDDFFAQMAVDSVLAIKTISSKGEVKYPIKSINALKAMGSSQFDSVLVKGYALNCNVASQCMVKRIVNAKIACLDVNFQKARMHMGVTLEIKDPSKIEDMRKRESQITMERIKKILDAGANVILTTKGIDDLCLKPFTEAGTIAVRRCKKEDVERVARATGAAFVSSLANLEGEESFEPSLLGSAEEVVQEKFGDSECILINGTKATPSASVVLRGVNELMLDEMERALHDAQCVVKKTLESGSIVPGGGAVETALSVFLENFATSIASREQIAVAEFGDALLVIPKTLAANGGKDSADLVSKLRAFHYAAQTASDDIMNRELKWSGLDLANGKVRSSVGSGIVEPAISKIKAIKAATEAAIAIMRIDDMITVAEQKQPREEEECY